MLQTNKFRYRKLTKIYKFPLLFALLIHLVFIVMLARLTPSVQKIAEEKPAKPALTSLSVSLQPAPAEIIKPEEPTPKPEAKPDPIVVEAVEEPPPSKEREIVQAAIPTSAEEEDNPIAQDQQNASLAVSSDYLHSQLMQQLLENRKLTKSARLGEFNSQKLPENWTRKAVSYTPGMFRSAQLPFKAEILDQWKNADGGMQNRVKLPNGDVVCGNLAAHNPLDIYSMPIWMYRSC